jgi:hypothetical protein
MPDNTQKDPQDWVSGSDPMTGAQSSYLKTLSEQATSLTRLRKTLQRQRRQSLSTKCVKTQDSRNSAKRFKSRDTAADARLTANHV